MQRQSSELDFSGQEVLVGLDVATKSWKVAIMVDGIMHRRFSQGPDPEALARYLRRNFPGGHYRCVYEAGYNGFWIQNRFEALGIECIVVNPLDVPTTNKEKVHKNDPVDASKLVRGLHSGQLRPIYIPSRSAQEDRSLVRMRATVVKKQTRCKNQIKALLAFYGIVLSDALAHQHWSRSYIAHLQQLLLERDAGTEALQTLVGELLYHRQTIAELTQKLRTLATQDCYGNRATVLMSVPGLGVVGAMTLLTELVDLDRFTSLDHLASYCGLVPGEHSSGERERTTGITHRRNPALRALLIQCAWAAVRQDPALIQAFTQLTKRMKKQQAIVHIARKLLNRIRFVLKNNQPYRCSVVKAA